jgi:putative SOS response-associated peptidase YedK
LEEWLHRLTIITTKPNELTTVHGRMPVILYPEDYDGWLMRVDGEIHGQTCCVHILLNSCLMRIHV